MRIRILVWNCNMRLHDKVGRLRALRPDVAVVCECACPEVLLRRADDLDLSDVAWEGKNPQKGLAILAFGPWRVEIARAHRPGVRTTLPIHLSGPAALRIVGVWALPPSARGSGGRPEPILEGIRRLATFLSGRPAIVAGDFSGTLTRRTRNGVIPSTLASDLAGRGFASAYHRLRGVAPGQESEPTFFRYRRFPGRHHVDQVWVDETSATRLRRVDVGFGPRWIGSSDHVPVLVELDTVGS